MPKSLIKLVDEVRGRKKGWILLSELFSWDDHIFVYSRRLDAFYSLECERMWIFRFKLYEIPQLNSKSDESDALRFAHWRT